MNCTMKFLKNYTLTWARKKEINISLIYLTILFKTENFIWSFTQ